MIYANIAWLRRREARSPLAGSGVNLRSAINAFLQLHAIEALGHREFRLLWLGHSFTSMAFWMDQVARGWLIYELTDSALQLGLVRGVQAIPTLLLSPLAGSTADRYSRKTQILVAQVIDGLMLAALALLIVIGEIQPWHVYATAFGMAVVQTFQQPARAAMIADLVPSSHLTNAIGLNSIIFNVARSTGPALAGVLIATFGTAGSYATQAVFYLLATVWTAQLQTAERSSPRNSRGHSVRGAPPRSKYHRRMEIQLEEPSGTHQPACRDACVSIHRALQPFLPVFARDILDVGATGQGLLLTAMGVGALGSAFIIARSSAIGCLGGSSCWGVWRYTDSVSWRSRHRLGFSLSMVLMVIVGFANVCSHALVQTVIQTYSPSEFRGRTMAIFHMSNVVMTIGSMLIGALAAVWGAPWASSSMALAGALAMVAIHVTLPGARHIRLGGSRAYNPHHWFQIYGHKDHEHPE